MIEQVKGTVDQYKQNSRIQAADRRHRRSVRREVDQGWPLRQGARGEGVQGRQVLLRPRQAGALAVKEKKWTTRERKWIRESRLRDGESEAQLCFDKLEEVEKDLPENVSQTLRSVVEKIRQMLPQASRRSPSSSRR